MALFLSLVRQVRHPCKLIWNRAVSQHRSEHRWGIFQREYHETHLQLGEQGMKQYHRCDVIMFLIITFSNVGNQHFTTHDLCFAWIVQKATLNNKVAQAWNIWTENSEIFWNLLFLSYHFENSNWKKTIVLRVWVHVRQKDSSTKSYFCGKVTLLTLDR